MVYMQSRRSWQPLHGLVAINFPANQLLVTGSRLYAWVCHLEERASLGYVLLRHDLKSAGLMDDVQVGYRKPDQFLLSTVAGEPFFRGSTLQHMAKPAVPLQCDGNMQVRIQLTHGGLQESRAPVC